MASETVKAPSLALAMECWEPDGMGGSRLVWGPVQGGNVVVNQGKGQLLNRAFGFQTASTFGPYLILHSATTASNHVWSNVSASSLGSYTNNTGGTSVVPTFTFATTHTSGSATASASYAFTAGTQTISGACMAWFTTNSLHLSNLSSTGAIAIYNNASLASQQVQLNNTVNITGTISFA